MIFSENIKINGGRIQFLDKNGGALSLSQACKKAQDRFYNWWMDFKLLVVNSIGNCPFWVIRKIVYKLAGLKILKSKIHVGCRFFEPSGIKIGGDTVIGEFAFLDGRAPLIIGSHVDIASQVLIYNSEHDINDESFRAREQAVQIEDFVFIGPRVVILPGVKIGKGAVVAAGAVVAENVAPFKIVGGVPAKEIGERKIKEPKYRLGRTRLFQ